MAFIKEESEDMKIEEAFRVKYEDTEEQTKMVLIKEESEEVTTEEAFRVKHEDTETQTGWFHTPSLYLVILHHDLFIYYTQHDKMNDVTIIYEKTTKTFPIKTITLCNVKTQYLLLN